MDIWKILLTLYLLFLFSAGAINATFEMEETNCSFQRNGSCYTQITLVLKENVSFSVNYKNAAGDSHLVLECAWMPAFQCLKGKGYNYTPPVKETFHIYIDQGIRCVIGGTFTIVFAQDIKKRCKKDEDLSDQNVSQQDRPKCQISHNLTDQSTTASGVE